MPPWATGTAGLYPYLTGGREIRKWIGKEKRDARRWNRKLSQQAGRQTHW